ncbi:MAG: mannose-1-phosphate guanylyltransferase/mannose-6-phosphate isomerase [bacterium]|nr:mannose-1-phosphate guanylyltransferase/mannose-6-phosphate isomerase [bacterium]
MKTFILAGGSGTRLWPMSRRNYPKQFLKINNDKSFLQQTIARLSGRVSLKDIIFITNDKYQFHVKSDISSLFPAHIILEPMSKNTAPAIALGVKYCIEKLSCGLDEVICVLPSDQMIKNEDMFNKYLKYAEETAKEGYMVTFGIKPLKPETGYGYIKVASCKSQVTSKKSEEINYLKVEKFVEKPDKETAQKYIESGDYYWNSGMFAFTIGTIIEELRKYAPQIEKLLEKNFDDMLKEFDKMPSLSIDYAVMEKSERVVTIPMDLYWSDIGSWDSFFDLLEKDKSGNAEIGDVVTIGTKNCLIIGDKRLITAIEMEDCLIIDTADATLIAKRGCSQKVKELIVKLEKSDRKEAVEHTCTYRPWGSYTVLEEGDRYKIKRIVININSKLSLQRHKHRSEHWVVIKGTAKVTIGEKELIIQENESAYIPKTTIHRLENPGEMPLEIIEIQNGEYLGEDDIERLDDLYGR